MGSIAVIGAGNVGQAIGGHMALEGHEIRIFSRWERDYAAIEQNGGITLTGEVEGTAVPHLLTTDVRVATDGADLVVVAAPAFAHPFLSEALATVVTPDQLVVFQPGVLGSAVELRRKSEVAGHAPALIAETATSLYTCRLRGPAEVYVGAIKNAVPISAIPNAKTRDVLARLEPYFGNRYLDGGDTLTVGLTNVNPVYHVPPAILNFKTVEEAARLPQHTLVSPRIGELINELDEERIGLGQALGVTVPSFWDFLETSYGVSEGGFVDRIVAGYGRQGFPEPDSIQHRYFTEDVPFGLLTWSSIASEIGVSMPLTDAFVRISAVLCGRDWALDGRTATTLGLVGGDAHAIKAAFVTGEFPQSRS
ncbi:hypothetical protein GCM10011512_08530 [Tersicoccus solisilvae]|uniref:Opine dehydrogenase n=1 Tax=Tersicoccus solisilvae TaxID=1882339 RepID=A0ABQ1NSU3_9MICC|nr:NAD/NADP-dependent octopine/nopaline dehydrogenase family protein [Tersicoccus solisilvae]GGC84041.1 hypothetical protein GCM10011512_08530 [Tersicoccus solisilvae]